MKRPTQAQANLFIVGAPKCGTTAWFEYLRLHPDIFITDIKEPTFFSLDLPGIRWISSLRDYERLFASAGSAKYLGDASSSYLFSRLAAKAIKEYNPDSRIIAFVRAQEDFLPSLHHEYLYSFREDRPFAEAWRLSGRRNRENVPKTCPEPSLVDYAARGRFTEQLQRYFNEFPASQVRVIRFSDWVKDPRATYLSILDFLGLDDDGRTHFPRINEAKSHRIKWLGKLIQNPPRFAKRLVGVVKKLTGKASLGLNRRALKLIASRGYTTTVDPELREEIRRYFEEDNRLLDELITKQSHEISAASERHRRGVQTAS